jgi:hypothetical protein
MPDVHRQKRKVTTRTKKQHKHKASSCDSGSSRVSERRKKATRGLTVSDCEEIEKGRDYLRMQEIQYLLDVANLITPPNWNVYVNPKDMKWKSRTLNILLLIHLFDDGVDWGTETWIGQKHDPQSYYPISIWSKTNAEVRKIIDTDGDRKIALTEIWMKEFWLDVDTLIHELAHVLVDRFLARKQKRYRPEDTACMVDNTEVDHHGAFFQRAYRIMIKRAEKILSDEELEPNRAELAMYEERLRLYGSADVVTRPRRRALK